MISRRELLIDAVKLLASEATVQLDSLGERGLAPSVNELAMEFDDIACARDDMLAKGELNASEHRAVAMLDAAFDKMTPADGAVWTPEAVKHDVRWADIRRLAAECHRKLCGG